MKAEKTFQKAADCPGARPSPGPRPLALGRRHARGPAPTGLTLLEVILALAVTVIVGTAAATMLYAASSGTSTQSDMRSVLMRHAQAADRLSSAVRSSRMVLDRGPNYLVLWMREERPNNRPNVSELRRIERDPFTHRLRSFSAADDLPQWLDLEFDLATTDFDLVTRQLRHPQFFPGTLWAEEVVGWTTAVPTEDVREARFVGYRITSLVEGAPRTTIGGATLRNYQND